MASKYFRKKQDSGLWWIKARSARSGALVRASLQTRDPAMAELIRKRLALELELQSPKYAGLEIPEDLRRQLGLTSSPPVQKPPHPLAPIVEAPSPAPSVPNALSVEEAVAAYYKHCREENSTGWVKNKISYLRAFLGSALVEKITGIKSRNKVRGYFQGKTRADRRPA